MHHDVEMIAHHCPGVNAAGKNLAEFQNAGFNPRLSVFKAFAEVFVQAAQPRSTHTAVDAVKCSGLCWIDELAARLCHARSLDLPALRQYPTELRVASDLSLGCSRRSHLHETLCQQIGPLTEAIYPFA